MKESFILYNSFYEPIRALKNEQLGKLLRAIFNYTINGEITQEDDILVAFMFIKNQIDLDAKKWKEEKIKRSEAGRLGGIQRAINKGLTISSKSKQCLDMLSNAKQNQANQGDNVNVNVNENVIKEENIKRRKFTKPTINEIQNYCNERNNGINAEAFYDFYESKDWYVGKNKMQDWKACIRTWEKRNLKLPIKKEPEWLNKKIQQELPTKDEKKEIEEFLKDFN